MRICREKILTQKKFFHSKKKYKNRWKCPNPKFSTQIPPPWTNFFGVKLFPPDILMYRPSWISCYMKIGWFFNLGPHPNTYIISTVLEICKIWRQFVICSPSDLRWTALSLSNQWAICVRMALLLLGGICWIVPIFQNYWRWWNIYF